MKNLYLLIAVAILTINATDTFAGELIIDKGVFTKHVDYRSWMNEKNELLTIEYKTGNHGVNASKFINTYGNDTLTIGGSYSVFDSKYFELDALYGIVKGYKKEQLFTVFHKNYGAYIAPRVTAKYEITNGFYVKSSVTLFGTAVIGTAGVGYEF